MTELTFLVDLLINHKLPKVTKELIVTRIKEVEEALVRTPVSTYRVSPPAAQPQAVPAHLVGQSPSTIAAMMRHEQMGAPVVAAVAPLPPPPTPATEAVQPAIIAQTPQTAMAMQARQEAIALAISGKPAKGETRPRKF